MNILFYLDKHALSDPMDSTMYVYEAVKDLYNTRLSFTEDVSLAKDADVIFHRLDIPWNEEFLAELDTKYNDGSRLFVNDPRSKIKFQSKEYLLQFPHLTPATILSSSQDQIVNFVDGQKDVVIKPFDENQGKGIYHIRREDYTQEEITHFVEGYLDKYPSAIVQKYIDNVETLGDKRVNVIDYEPVSAILRLPQKGSFICNLSAGGSAHATEITERDRQVIEDLVPLFKRNNLPWVGVDLIGPYLGEFNTSSPGNLIEADYENGNTVGRDAVVNMLERYSRNL